MIFVGERQSPKAARYGHTWASGQAAAATLHRALQAAGIDPNSQEFLNLWSVPGLRDPKRPPRRDVVRRLRKAARVGERVVAMGALVQRELARHKIPCTPLIHPAARGKVRRRDLYEQHVRERLTEG